MSVAFLRRLGKGEPIGIGILANVLIALNLEGTLPDVANHYQDEVGIAMEKRNALKRIHNRSCHELDTDF